MIVAHLSDLHLGFRAHGRTERGRDVRESDVATAFQRAVQDILRIRPDLVVIAGDLFDHPVPPPSALVTLTRGLETLREALPDAPVLLIAGARDIPPSGSEPGVLAALDTLPGVEAVTSTARSVVFRERDLRVLLIPHPVLGRPPLPELRPDPRVGRNVLVAHVTLPDGDDGVPLDPADWDYVALGGSHRHAAPAPNVRYSGSLERVGLHPWSEAAEEKGFVLWDLERGEGRLHTLPGRPVVSLAPLRFPPEDPRQGEGRIAEVLNEVPGGIDGKLVRLPVRGLDPRTLEATDLRVLAPFRRRALHLQVEALAPDGGAPTAAGNGGGGLTALLVLRSRDRAVLREARGGAEPGEGMGDPGTFLDLLLEGGGRGPEDPSPSAARRTPAEVARLEEEVRTLRSDAAELGGDVEVSTMEWLRERQDAETRLQAYRDHARELKVRIRQLDAAGPEAPCPTCGRLLDEHHDDVVEELRDEWEAVVQDGQWWKRRREQLELKPEKLQDLELRQMRLQAALEEKAERLERARAVSGPGEGETPIRSSPHPVESTPPRDVGLLELAGARLGRITGGRLVGFLPRTPDGALRVAGPETRGVPDEEEDRAAVRAALRLGAAELAPERLRRLLFPLEEVTGMAPDDRIRLVELLREILPRIPRIALETDGLEVERVPDFVDRVVQVRERADRGEAPTLHVWRPGPAALRLRSVSGVPAAAR